MVFLFFSYATLTCFGGFAFLFLHNICLTRFALRICRSGDGLFITQSEVSIISVPLATFLP